MIRISFQESDGKEVIPDFDGFVRRGPGGKERQSRP
jgi:hypothetical protein